MGRYVQIVVVEATKQFYIESSETGEKHMDNFFAKKGIGLSKYNNPTFPPPRQQLLRSSENITWNHYAQTQAIRPTTDFSWGVPPPYPSISFVSQPQQALQKNQSFMQLPPSPPKILKQGFSINPTKRKDLAFSHARKSSDLSAGKRSTSRENLLNINKDIQAPSISTECKTTASFAPRANDIDINPVTKEIRSLFDIMNSKREINENRPISMTNLEANSNKVETNPKGMSQLSQEMLRQIQRQKEELIKRQKEMHLMRERETALILQKEENFRKGQQKQRELRLMRENQERTRQDREESLKREQKTRRDRSIEARKQHSEQKRKQIQVLSVQNRQYKSTSGFWIQQKLKLQRQLQQKDTKIFNLQKSLCQQQRQYKTKIMMLDYDMKKVQASANRLDIQHENARKLLQVQRMKNEKAQEEKDKLMFFQDDLIHAKDFSRLKRELDDALTQNAKMYQDHQKYIIQVAEMRRTYSDKIQDLQSDIMKIKHDFFKCRQKIQGYGSSSDDKRMLIKLQHQINFLLKKGQQSMTNFIQQQDKLEKAHLQIKAMTQKNNRDDQSHQNFIQGMNLTQLLETVSRYEGRLSDMNDLLDLNKIQIDKQKRTIESLTTELREAREDKKINSIKEKSSENILKNEVAALQQSLRSEIHIRCKKISALQEKVQRKTKECEGKDKFIKEFLLNRVKDIEKSHAREIIQKINNFLMVDEDSEQVTQTAQSQEVSMESEGTVDM